MPTQRATDTEPKNFHKVTDHIWISGSIPLDAVDALHKEGISAVLDMTPDADEPEVKNNFAYLQLNQDDHAPMPADKIEKGLAFLTKHVGAGDNVLVHCKEGRSRSATMITAFLMKSEKLSWDKAFAKVHAAQAIADPAGSLRTSVLDYFKQDEKGNSV